MPDCFKIETSAHPVKTRWSRGGRSLLLAAAFALIVAASVPAVAQDCGHHRHHDDHDDAWHCDRNGYGGRSAISPARPAASTETVHGTIDEIVYLTGTSPDSGMVELRLSASGQPLRVQLAPVGFLKQGGMLLKSGDAITVKGVPISSFDGDLLAATMVQKGDKSLALRNSRGWPLW